jgi:hypothetical protein
MVGNERKMKTENIKSFIIRWFMPDGPSAGGVPGAGQTRRTAAAKKFYVKFRAVRVNVPLIVRNCSASALAKRRAPTQTCLPLHRHLEGSSIRRRNNTPPSRGAARVGCFQIEKAVGGHSRPISEIPMTIPANQPAIANETRQRSTP